MSDPIPITASPTKTFFVRMLTRDIDLRYAILDLLDNCVDGIVRTLSKAKEKPKPGTKQPYKGFQAVVTATPKKFVIEDNCGGIPRDIAIKSAFRLGRPSSAAQEKLETVGVYGIGMKRAIFKLGRQAVVSSEHQGSAFRVRIAPEWLDEDENWDLKLEEVAPTGSNGTRIEVTDLYPDVQREFNSETSNFLPDLNGAIRELYAVIMGKGFAVKLNKDELEPIEFRLLVSTGKDAGVISPYVFKGRIGKVDAEVVVGFYRKPLTDAEMDEENELPRADLAQAGWSVICNDRLILRSDKTAVTGWGTDSVPRFHNQFSSIAGVVTLRSTDPQLLPLNTTKRGIETSSDVYFRLLEYMRTGMRQFITYTNRWKAKMDEAKGQFEAATSRPAAEIPDAVPKDEFKKISSRKIGEDAEAVEYQPALPQPPKEKSDLRRISFSKPVGEIRTVAKELLDDEDVAPSEVGEACFDSVLERAKRTKRKS